MTTQRAASRILQPVLRTIVLILAMVALTAATFKEDKYKEADLAKLKATPEEFKNDRVFFETTYRGFLPTFPNYIELSGYKADKYYCLQINPAVIPVMARKKGELNEIIPTLKSGAKVKLYGKIKKFTRVPEAKMMPRYHLELDKLVVVEAEPAKDDKDEDQPRRRRPLRPFRR